MKLWLDDVREPPDESWTWAKDVFEANYFLLKLGDEEWTHASIDHDLATIIPGIRFLDNIAELNQWPTVEIRVHSMNPVGVQQMMALIDRYGPYTQRPASNVRRMG